MSARPRTPRRAARGAAAAHVSAPRDSVLLEGLTVQAVVGVLPHERRAPQRLEIDVELSCDAARAARRDDLREALDYAAVAREVQRWVVARRARLLETLAEGLAARLRARFGATWVRLTLRKPAAVPAARAAGVRVERGVRHDAAGGR